MRIVTDIKFLKEISKALKGHLRCTFENQKAQIYGVFACQTKQIFLVKMCYAKNTVKIMEVSIYMSTVRCRGHPDIVYLSLFKLALC
jgi:hypothetical protein